MFYIFSQKQGASFYSLLSVASCCCSVNQPHGGDIAQQFCPSTFEWSGKLVLYADNIKATLNFFPCFGFLFRLFYAFFKNIKNKQKFILLIWCFPIPFCNTLSAYCFAETHPLLHFFKTISPLSTVFILYTPVICGTGCYFPIQPHEGDVVQLSQDGEPASLFSSNDQF